MSLWTALLLAAPCALMLGLLVGHWWAIPAAMVAWLLFVRIVLPLTWGESNVTLEPGIRTWLENVYAAVTWLGIGLTGALCFIGIVARRARDVSRGLDPLV
jgi:hypothetical protein